MQKRILVLKTACFITLSCFSLVSLGIASVAWFSSKKAQSPENINGVVGLRSYFYQGDGSQNNPYEIVFPSHFYNLSRLQNLGVFSEKNYFRVGHNFNGTEDNPIYQIMHTDSNGIVTYDKELDMSEFDYSSSTILAIGGEGAPFVGDFNGEDINIKNLIVTGYPEDIGMFGYIASTGSVKNLVTENLTINSIGYTDVSSSNINHLFGADVEQIFDQAENIFANANLKFTTNEGNEYLLRSEEGITGVSFPNINHSTNTTITNTPDPSDPESTIENIYYNGYFTPIFPATPSEATNFSYEWRFNNTLIEKIDEQGKINLGDLKRSSDFNSKNAQIDSRIYLIAKYDNEGVTYSRVIQTYAIQFYSNSTQFNEGGYSMKIYCDYAGEGHTNYHHGNNIGYLAGHVDGTMKDCFVFNGTINFNNSSNMVPIATESDTGLIGEIGKNVRNVNDPSFGGGTDTGTMDFTGIYNLVRENAEIGKKVFASIDGKGTNFISYNTQYNSDESIDKQLLSSNENFEKYREFLRYNDTNNILEREYITKLGVNVETNSFYEVPSNATRQAEVNTIDFLYNRVISDTPEVDRGLGVFKIATGYNSSATYDIASKSYTFTDGQPWGSHYTDGIGSSKIINGTQETTIYFSTAEYNHKVIGDDNPWYESIGNHTSPTAYRLENMSALPTSALDIRTFNPIYERDFDYVFKLDLTENLSTNDSGKNYFSNTDSLFLQQYFKYKLIDKNGQSLEPGEERFGFMFRDLYGQLMTNISSYMPVNKPESLFEYDGKYYPANSITFTIENPNGANVSVVASGDKNTSIYSFDPSKKDISKVEKAYTMFSKTSSNTTDANPIKTDIRKYFSYNHSTGETSTVVETPNSSSINLDRSSSLYAHIFKLPPGDYCIGASEKGTANIYFLAVQGQTEGTSGDVEMPALGDAVIEVDFLLEEYDPSEEKRKAKFYLIGNFAATTGAFTVTATDGVIHIIFDETGGYVISLTARDDNNTEHDYWINSHHCTQDKTVYPFE